MTASLLSEPLVADLRAAVAASMADTGTCMWRLAGEAGVPFSSLRAFLRGEPGRSLRLEWACRLADWCGRVVTLAPAAPAGLDELGEPEPDEGGAA